MAAPPTTSSKHWTKSVKMTVRNPPAMAYGPTASAKISTPGTIDSKPKSTSITRPPAYRDPGMPAKAMVTRVIKEKKRRLSGP